nr:hypothetical protein B0A51_14884 [Rachicladosporium sp. CCFEE 5018]
MHSSKAVPSRTSLSKDLAGTSGECTRPLSVRSIKYFMRACAGGFAEASSGPIDLSSDDANALGAVIKYFYTGEYPISRSFEGVDPYLRPSEPELLEDPMHVLSRAECKGVEGSSDLYPEFAVDLLVASSQKD